MDTVHTRDMNNTAAAQTTTVVAEDAPIGIQLWPTRSPEFAPNFTLASVEIVRTEVRRFVRWTYQSGNVRTFDLGEKVAVIA